MNLHKLQKERTHEAPDFTSFTYGFSFRSLQHKFNLCFRLFFALFLSIFREQTEICPIHRHNKSGAKCIQPGLLAKLSSLQSCIEMNFNYDCSRERRAGRERSILYEKKRVFNYYAACIIWASCCFLFVNPTIGGVCRCFCISACSVHVPTFLVK